MSREPLYPHVPKRREPLYPHVPGGSATPESDMTWKEAPGIETNWHLIIGGQPVALISKDLQKGDYLVSPIGSIRIVGVGPTLEEAKKVAERLWSNPQDLNQGAIDRQGRCYELAFQFIKREEEGLLVHGRVFAGPTPRWVNHAWVETETGFVYEPVYQRFYRKEEFFKAFYAEADARYTWAEAAALALRHKHFGPWGEKQQRVPMAIGLDLTETLPPLTKEEFLRQYRMGTHYYTPEAARRHGAVPRYWYHVPRGKADFGKTVKAYPIREIEAADTFGKGYRDAHYLWLSHQPIYGRDNAYIIDLTKLNNDDLRFTGQVEGNLLHRGDIPADAVVAIMREGSIIQKPEAFPMTQPKERLFAGPHRPLPDEAY